MAGGCAADGPYALTTAVWLSRNFRSRKSVRTVEWRNWPCPKRIMTKGAILKTSRSITLTVKNCHRSLTITNTRLEIQGRHRCPTQTASLSTNLSNCQTVVNRLLDRVRLLPGTRKIQTSRDDIIDVFDFSSAGHPSVAIKLFLGVGIVLILRLLKWRIQPQDEPGRGVIKRDLPESGQAGADEPSAEPLLGWSFHRRTSNLLPRSTSPPDQRRRRAVRRVGGRLVLASQQLPTRLPALPMGANIDYTFVH